MTKQEMVNTVMDRASEMLKNEEINKIYQSMENEDIAKDWIFKQALATLMIPVNER